MIGSQYIISGLCTCLDLNGGDASMSLGFLIVPMEGWRESSGETCLRERDMFLHNSYSIKESETLIHNMSNINVCIVKLIKPMCKYKQCLYDWVTIHYFFERWVAARCSTF